MVPIGYKDLRDTEAHKEHEEKINTLSAQLIELKLTVDIISSNMEILREDIKELEVCMFILDKNKKSECQKKKKSTSQTKTK